MSMNSVALISTGGQFRIVYKDGEGEISERVIRVERIFTHEATNNRLIVAWCYRKNAYRTFNAAGILAAMPDDSTQITTFAMSAAVTAQDTDAFIRAYAMVHAA
jgi:predicted DNA-binding transcriptional regulator YafY